MREIIVDRENGAKAFVLFELTKGNIAEIKDRYILEQLRSAIDSPWSTALPDGIRSALTRSVSEEMEDRFLVSKWKVYVKLGMPGWYSHVPIFSDRKLYEHVRGNEENKTLLMAYLIISLLTIAQLVTIIFFLNNLVQIFV